MFAKFLFLYCALVILGCATAAVRMRNPVHSVLSVLILFFHIAILYLLLNAEFLAALQVIVYGGGILVLYLFVVFLVSLRNEVKIDAFVGGNRSIALVLSIVLGLTMLTSLRSFTIGTATITTPEPVKAMGHTKAVGLEMFSNFLPAFEVAGIILLVAVIGGLVLARKDPDDLGSIASTQHSLREDK